MPDGMTSGVPEVFTSWKEIAAYLGKGVRTIQRWEAQFALPIQRPNARSKGIVRATREDLDRWIATRWSPKSENATPATPATHDTIGTNEKTEIPARVVVNLDDYRQLRQQNRVLLEGVRQSLKALAHNCEDLAVSTGRFPNAREGHRLQLERGISIVRDVTTPHVARKKAQAE